MIISMSLKPVDSTDMLFMSPQITFAAGKLSLYVSHAALLKSIAPTRFAFLRLTEFPRLTFQLLAADLRLAQRMRRA